MGGQMLVVGTPDLAGEVLHAPPGTYLAGAANRRILPVLPENTVLTLDGDEHRARRRGWRPCSMATLCKPLDRSSVMSHRGRSSAGR